ncbi:50S ribosomal protein L23 [bacterium]|nr:50S ribosomal protein L23 [bacterium]
MADIKKEKKQEEIKEEKIDSKQSKNWYFLNSILLKPVVSEKSQILTKEDNKYIFKVSSSANKFQIKKAVEDFYGVSVLNVNVLNRKGKKTRFGVHLGKRKNERQAIVTVKQGQSIDIFK